MVNIKKTENTNEIALNLIERLVEGWQEGDDKSIFLVGDPMQSIYRFRESQVGIFIQVMRNGIANININSLEDEFQPSRTSINSLNFITKNEEEKIKTIREFASKFDLVLFVNDDCPYCKAFLPVVSSFAKEYGFTLNSTGLNTPQGKMAIKLGITAVPTLVAISKDAKELFELARGFISFSELQDNVVLGHAYSIEKQQAQVKRFK